MRPVVITKTILGRPVTLVPAVVIGFCMASGLVGCGALDVSDPTAIEERELNNATGAQLLRGAALRALSEALDDGALLSGMLADEFLADPPLGTAPGTSPDELLDRRESVQFEALRNDRGYVFWQELRLRRVPVAITTLRAYALPGAREAHVGEMFALRGFAALRLAEDYCPGFPLHEVVDYKVVYGPPLSTEEAFVKAVTDFDSAAAYAADSARVLNLARIWRGRALLGLGRFEEAAAAVADVPTEYLARAEYRNSVGLNNEIVFGLFGSLSRSVADGEGGVGLDFVAAADPRVQTNSLGTARDGVTGIYRITKYQTQDAPVVLANGIEARLIEAEAALRANNSHWLGILNALRTTCIDAATCPDPAPAGSGGVAGLPPLTDPGTEMARQNLLFRERAFWLFATGHRLADLRRLVRFYGRPAENVFPAGTYRLGGSYGTATSIPFPAWRETPFNSAVTGCTSR